VPRPVPGFPDPFPVRADGRRPWRYRMVSGFWRWVLRLLLVRRLHFEGVEGVPMEGPLLVASNHISNWDPLIYGSFFPGTLFAMAKRELFRPAPVAWVLGGCNCFPVDRGSADRRALRIGLDLLRRGRRLLVFVEGTRSRHPGMGPAEAGAGFLVRRTGAPVLPVAIWGTERAFVRTGGLLPRRGHIRVRYGRPFSVSESSDREIADRIAAEVAALLPSRYRGVHASGRRGGGERRVAGAAGGRCAGAEGGAGERCAEGGDGEWRAAAAAG
jgi:1-acyl-sn-glycerol-3-phosphate acyltransferase